MIFTIKKDRMLSTSTQFKMVAVLFSVSLAACSGNESKQPIQQEAPVMVQVSNAGGTAAAGMIEASGQVEAIRSANISTRVMGYITSIQVKAGDKVRAGQVLFSVNSSDVQAKKAQTDAMIAQADAALQSAQKDYDRYTALFKQQSASAKELDAMTLQYQSAKASAAAARAMRSEVTAQLAYTTVVAPFSGTVTQKLAEAGSMATPGMPVLTIEQEGGLQVSASIPESQIASVKTGDEATMTIESANKKITGKVTQVNPSSQFTGGQYIVKIALPSADSKQLYAGMYVHLQLAAKNNSIPKANDSANVMIPVKALINRDQLTGVYTVSSQNTALLRWLRLGPVSGDQVEVLSGLAKNEPFIVSAEGKLYNGVPVKIK
jgi:RND family efflux transporter MFP subunit